MSLGKLGPKIKNDGNLGETPVEDVDSNQLLMMVLKELRILNLHMAVMTDNHFVEGDVE